MSSARGCIYFHSNCDSFRDTFTFKRLLKHVVCRYKTNYMQQERSKDSVRVNSLNWETVYEHIEVGGGAKKGRYKHGFWKQPILETHACRAAGWTQHITPFRPNIFITSPAQICPISLLHANTTGWPKYILSAHQFFQHTHNHWHESSPDPSMWI